MVTITLPSRVTEGNLLELIQTLGTGNEHETIELDFQYFEWYIPAALLALTAKVCRWRDDGKRPEMINCENTPAFTYLQRMDFFQHCGVDFCETFDRHDPSGRFVPIRELNYREVDSSAKDVAECIAPDLANFDDPEETGFFDCITYSVSELSNNAGQHSHGKGFVAAQYVEKSDFTRVAIVDTGIGIRESFKETGSRFYSENMTDIEAILKALEPEVSSKSDVSGWGDRENAGVGLSLVWDLTKKLNGSFHLISGCGYYSLRRKLSFPTDYQFNGTLCAFGFKRRNIASFNRFLLESKRDLGLLKDMTYLKGVFE